MYIQVCNDDSRSVEIYCEITDEQNINDGRPFLFVLPGGPGFDHMIYKNNTRFLEEIAHIVYIDPRGCGKSTSCLTLREYDIETYINDVESVRKHLNLDRIYMLGFSYGSMVALGYASRYCQHMSGLVIVAGAPSCKFLDLAKVNLEKIGNEEQKNFCAKHLWNGNFRNKSEIDEFFRIMTPLYSVKAQKQNLEDKVSPYANANCSIEHINQAFKTNFWGFDFTNELKNITCSALIVYGESDWVNDPSFAFVIKNKISHSNIHILQYCGHSVVADQPEIYQKLVKDFIANNDGSVRE